MSDLNTSHPLPQVTPHIPANLSPEILESWLRSRAPLHFTAVPLPPCFRLKIGYDIHTGKPSGATLPMSGWAIVVSDGRIQQTVLLGLEEDDAKTRAGLLNQRTAPTGFHSRN